MAQGRESAYHVQGSEFDAQQHQKGEKQNVGVHTSERMSTRPSHAESFPLCLPLLLVLGCDGGIHSAGD